MILGTSGLPAHRNVVALFRGPTLVSVFTWADDSTAEVAEAVRSDPYLSWDDKLGLLERVGAVAFLKQFGGLL